MAAKDGDARRSCTKPPTCGFTAWCCSLARRGPLADVLAELERREGLSGIEEKAARPKEASDEPTASSARSSKGEIPEQKVYEDEDMLAFHDIHPQAPVHFMIIPKEHVDSLADVDERHERRAGPDDGGGGAPRPRAGLRRRLPHRREHRAGRTAGSVSFAYAHHRRRRALGAHDAAFGPLSLGPPAPQEIAMGSFSIWHWLIVLVIVLLIFGTKKLRNIGEDLGGAVKGFKQGMSDEGNAAAPSPPARSPSQGTDHRRRGQGKAEGLRAAPPLAPAAGIPRRPLDPASPIRTPQCSTSASPRCW